jgi:hydroxypyruvate isomerase
LTGAIDTVKHIQIADVPGKGEPGSGGVDWRQLLSDLHGLGYAGAIGLEYVPTMDTARSILGIREILAGI